MFPTVTVEHLASVPATDDSDDMKIYQFDREASMDFYTLTYSCCCSSGGSIIGSRYTAYDEVLAA